MDSCSPTERDLELGHQRSGKMSTPAIVAICGYMWLLSNTKPRVLGYFLMVAWMGFCWQNPCDWMILDDDATHRQ